MGRFFAIHDLCEHLLTRQYFSPEYRFERIRDVIEAVMILASKVQRRTDLHMSMHMDGLPDCLPREFLSTLILESDSRDFQERFAPEIDLLLRKSEDALDNYEMSGR